MSLAKSFVHPSGYTVGYWSLGPASFNQETGGITCMWYGYADKATKDAGNAPLMEKDASFQVAPSNIPTAFKTFLHTQTIALPEWSGATSVA